MKRLGVVANCSKSAAPAVLARLARKAEALGLRTVACDEACGLLPGAERCEPAAFARAIDVCLVLGGDGTMLHAVRLLDGADLPVLGVNLGGLGFMTSVTEENLERALDALVSGGYATSVRTVAHCALVRGGRTVDEHRALNDIVLGWGETSRIVTLGLKVNGAEVGEYRCDGLIVSTPTGSTGHSLSAGGPIVVPETPVFVLDPICPHTLSNRPMVVPDDSSIEIAVLRSTKRQILVIDGQDHHEMVQGDSVVVRKAPAGVRFVHLPGYSYFAVLRQKLGWNVRTPA